MEGRFGRRILIAVLVRSAVLVASTALGLVRTLQAQGVTTSAIRGVVRSAPGSSVASAQVVVRNMATGATVQTEIRHGRFLISGLEVGGPYVVTVRCLGLAPQQSAPLTLTLGVVATLDFDMRPFAAALDTVSVVARLVRGLSPEGAGGGIGTTISDSLLHRLPTLNRNFQDFVLLAPQVSTRVGLAAGGISGGGVGFRFDRYLIDGVPESFPTGNSSLAFADGKSVPLAAVQEYQVLVAPFDARYGNFAGALVNTVTRSGTNALHGSLFAYGRNDELARSGDSSPPYERSQYGFSLGGPIVRDRLHFFVAPELQHYTYPAAGPYVGQPATASPSVPVSEADIARFTRIMQSKGLVAGSAGPVENGHPLTNLFARLDLALPAWNSRVEASVNYGRGTTISFTRPDTFYLSTYQLTQPADSRLIQAQLQTTLRRAGGGQNALQVSHQAASGQGLSGVRQPIVRVTVLSTSGDSVLLQSGTNEAAQGMFSSSQTIRLVDHLTLPLGIAHVLDVGVEAARIRIDRGGVRGGWGTWTFANLDSLAAGSAQGFQVTQDPSGTANIPLESWQYGAYIGDRWQIGQRFSISLGARVDKLVIDGHPPYNHAVDSIYHRRTDIMPSWSPVLSPRLGFNWDVGGAGRDVLRGGVGVFAGPPPLSWPHVALYSYGAGVGVLQCGSQSTDQGLPPPFEPDIGAVPRTCATNVGSGSAPRDVDLLDPHLSMARALRASLGYERQLPGGLLGGGEVLVTRNLSDFVFVNLNLTGVQSVDRFGRVLYGTINDTGKANPAVLSKNFSEVIDLINTSQNHSIQLAARLEKRASDRLAVSASYTYSRVWDAQTPLRAGTGGTVNWASRAVSGREDDLTPSISLNNVPHRVVLAVNWSAPWRRWTTMFSLFYVGESGSPFTYLAYGVGKRGDLNADGSNANDPIYIPRSAFDTSEILFTGRSDSMGADASPPAQAARVSRQQSAFEQFVTGSSCLARQRGHIMARNSCQAPWTNTTIVSVRQAIPAAGGAFEAELDVFNVLNLLDRNWGLYRVAAPALLEHVGQTSGAAGTTQPIFRFNARSLWTTLPAESAFQLQLALTYRF